LANSPTLSDAFKPAALLWRRVSAPARQRFKELRLALAQTVCVLQAIADYIAPIARRWRTMMLLLILLTGLDNDAIPRLPAVADEPVCQAASIGNFAKMIRAEHAQQPNKTRAIGV
jgi:hypothetical protein